MSEILLRNFQLLVCCGLLHQLSVTEISDAFCHSVAAQIRVKKTTTTIVVLLVVVKKRMLLISIQKCVLKTRRARHHLVSYQW
jgi:hypothetical protein